MERRRQMLSMDVNDQPARRVVEEPRRGLLPYIAAGAVAAVVAWSVLQPDVSDFTPARNGVQEKRTAPPTRPGPNKAEGEVRTIFSADDYPASAQRAGQEGTVQANLTVDPRGRVRSCRVIRSSGVPSIDKATCSIIRRRARFIPAHDAQGKAIEDDLTTPPIVWRLER